MPKGSFNFSCQNAIIVVTIQEVLHVILIGSNLVLTASAIVLQLPLAVGTTIFDFYNMSGSSETYGKQRNSSFQILLQN